MFALVIAALSACAPDDPRQFLEEELTVDGARWPNLSPGEDGTVLMSFLNEAGSGHSLEFARRTATGWTHPARIARGEDWFANWADFPSLSEGQGGMLAHWLVRSGDAPYAYDVALAHSTDGGATWTSAGSPHSDGTATEHGFVSVAPSGDEFDIVWLDGRNTLAAAEHDAHGHGGAMGLRHARLSAKGKVLRSGELDSMTCDCCQTDIVQAAAGPLVVYRDRSEEEVRDIALAQSMGDEWQAPVTVAEDNWVIAGCPVNGPSAATSGMTVAVAWFTAASNRPAIRISLSDDGGRTFPLHKTIADGDDLVGRVDVVIVGDEAVVSYVRKARDADDGWLSLVRVAPNGQAGRATDLIRVNPARSGGFPRMLSTGDELVFAWTGSRGVQVASIAHAALPAP